MAFRKIGIKDTSCTLNYFIRKKIRYMYLLVYMYGFKVIYVAITFDYYLWLYILLKP